MFAFACVERDSGRAGARARPARRQAAVPRRAARRRAALRLDAAGAAGARAASTRASTRSRCTTTSRWHSVVPAPRTILRGVRKLAAGHGAGRRARRRGAASARYWDPPFERDPARADWTPEDWQDAMLEALRVAVRRRMVADVPVGVLLSGGLDSSLIVALLAEAGPARAGDVLDRLPRRRRPRGRRVRVLRPGGRASSAPTTTRSGSAPSGCCRRCRRRSPR